MSGHTEAVGPGSTGASVQRQHRRNDKTMMEPDEDPIIRFGRGSADGETPYKIDVVQSLEYLFESTHTNNE